MRLFKVMVNVWYNDYESDTNTHIVVAEDTDSANSQFEFGEVEGGGYIDHLLTEEVIIEGYKISVNKG